MQKKEEKSERNSQETPIVLIKPESNYWLRTVDELIDALMKDKRGMA